MSDWNVVKRHKGTDWPPIFMLITDDDGAAVDLTDATILLRYRSVAGGVWSEVAGQADGDPTAGIARAVLPTTTEGFYIGYFEVTQAGKVFSSPDDGYLDIEVLEG